MLIEQLHSPMASHPLISTIVTLYTIIFLYFPAMAASPLIISTSVLLLLLLRLGVAQRISKDQTEKRREFDISDCTNFENDSVVELDLDSDPLLFQDDDSNVESNCEKDSVVEPDPDLDPIQFHDDGFVDDSNCEKEPESRQFYGDCFVEWNVRAPLEVIYEAYEGEQEEDDEGEYAEEKRKEAFGVIERHASLSMYYPETDTDTDTDSSYDGDSLVIGNWDSPENMYFRWDDDEDGEELIEIELDCKRNSEAEEENLIEIDLTLAKFRAR
ncbi:hypothetical protein P3S67_024034 [Capsicum chacoense]